MLAPFLWLSPPDVLTGAPHVTAPPDACGCIPPGGEVASGAVDRCSVIYFCPGKGGLMGLAAGSSPSLLHVMCCLRVLCV